MKFKALGSQKGIIAIGVYWIEWALDLIPLGFACFGIYLITVLGNNYWQKVSGVGSLACTILAVIFAIASIVINMSNQFGCMQSIESLLKYLYYAVTIIGLIIHAILLKFFTPISAERGKIDFHEYTTLNYLTDSTAMHYYNLSQTSIGQYEIIAFIWDRTVTQKIPTVSFFVFWGVFFALFLLGSSYLDGSSGRNANHENAQPLNPQEQPPDDLQPLQQVNDEAENQNPSQYSFEEEEDNS